MKILILFALLFSVKALAVLPMYSGQTTVIFDSNGTAVTSTSKGLKVDTSGSTVAPTPVALTIFQAQVSIGTSAVRLTHNGSAPATTRVLLALNLDQASTASCYVGSSSVATSGAATGMPLPAGQVFTFNLDAGDYYGICNSASQTFYILEQE